MVRSSRIAPTNSEPATPVPIITLLETVPKQTKFNSVMHAECIIVTKMIDDSTCITHVRVQFTPFPSYPKTHSHV